MDGFLETWRYSMPCLLKVVKDGIASDDKEYMHLCLRIVATHLQEWVDDEQSKKDIEEIMQARRDEEWAEGDVEEEPDDLCPGCGKYSEWNIDSYATCDACRAAPAPVVEGEVYGGNGVYYCDVALGHDVPSGSKRLTNPLQSEVHVGDYIVRTDMLPNGHASYAFHKITSINPSRKGLEMKDALGEPIKLTFDANNMLRNKTKGVHGLTHFMRLDDTHAYLSNRDAAGFLKAFRYLEYA